MTASHATIVLGSTGTMGAFQVDHYVADSSAHVVALAAAGNNLPLLAQQAVELEVFGIAVREADAQVIHEALDEANLKAGKDVRPEVLIGPEVVTQAAAAGAQTVVNAIRGIAGLRPSIAALEAGANLAVANTETLLAKSVLQQHLPDGELLQDRLTLLDPSLRRIQHTLENNEASRVVITTRSTEFFHGRRRNTARRINAQTGFMAGQALLELRAITQVPIDVVEHDGPIASIIELADGRSILTPRRYLPSTWSGSTQWSFKETHLGAIEFVEAVVDEGGTYPVVLYTGYQAAVAAHLAGDLEFDDISRVVETLMDTYAEPTELSVQSTCDAAEWAQEQAESIVGTYR